MRKGQMETLFQVFYLFVIMLLVFLLAVQLGFFNVAHENERLQAHLIMEHVQQGVAIEEPLTGRLLDNSVDLRKMGASNLVGLYKEGFGDENRWGGRVSLYVTFADLEAETNPLRSGWLDKEGSKANNLLPSAKAGIRGRGGGEYFYRVVPVEILLSDNVDVEHGWLLIELVRRT